MTHYSYSHTLATVTVFWPPKNRLIVSSYSPLTVTVIAVPKGVTVSGETCISYPLGPSINFQNIRIEAYHRIAISFLLQSSWLSIHESWARREGEHTSVQNFFLQSLAQQGWKCIQVQSWQLECSRTSFHIKWKKRSMAALTGEFGRALSNISWGMMMKEAIWPPYSDVMPFWCSLLLWGIQ